MFVFNILYELLGTELPIQCNVVIYEFVWILLE